MRRTSVCFAFFAALIIIGVNVGLESPYYLMIFIFSMGRCAQQAKALTDTDEPAPNLGRWRVRVIIRR